MYFTLICPTMKVQKSNYISLFSTQLNVRDIPSQLCSSLIIIPNRVCQTILRKYFHEENMTKHSLLLQQTMEASTEINVGFKRQFSSIHHHYIFDKKSNCLFESMYLIKFKTQFEKLQVVVAYLHEFTKLTFGFLSVRSVRK